MFNFSTHGEKEFDFKNILGATIDTAERNNIAKMDDEDYDNIQLVSLSEVHEIYYQMLKKEMEASAAEISKKKGFDGSIPEKAADQLFELAERSQITNFSQSLAELLMLLELQNEKKVPAVDEFAIYNSLLRLEKAGNNTSSWELYSEDDDGRLITLSNFEVNMLEQNFSLYIEDTLNGNKDQTLFFPLIGLHQSDVIVKWRIFEKISSIKVTPQQTIYKQKLAEYVKKRVQDEVSGWLEAEFHQLKLSGKNTVLKDVEFLAKSLKSLRTHLEVATDILSVEGTLFKEISCCYFDCISRTLDGKLYPICVQLMKSMDTYQEYHKGFHVNLRDSCALSHVFYLQIKKLVQCLKVRRKVSYSSQLEDFNSLFVKFFMNLLQVMKSECHGRIKRAVQIETKDSVHTEERILSSSVIVLNCFCTVIDEWKHIDIEDEDLQVAFLIKITDVVCDGAKIFAEALDHRLDEENKQTKDLNLSKKICILANSIQHVRQYLKNLPHQMQWVETLQSVNEESHTSFGKQILRILNLIHQSMDSQLNSIIEKMMNTAVSSLTSNCEKHLLSWIEGNSVNQSFDRFMCTLNDCLEPMQDTLKDELFPKFLSQQWSSLLMFIQNNFQEGLQPEYAKLLKETIQSLMDYFLYIKMEESEINRPIMQQILSIIDLNSKSTVELQLDYYSQVAESIASPVEYLGHIAFQAGYKVSGEETVDLYINVQKGQRLPTRKFEMEEIYVKLELCPSSMFPNQVPLKSVSATNDLDNPVFNQFFQFSNLPSNSLNVKGAVVQVLVLNQDSSYSSVAVLLLNQVQNMSGFTSLEFLPVYLMPLKKFDMSQISYQVLINRSRWDKNAKLFINSRNKLVKRPKKFLPCIPGKNTCVC